MIGKKKLNALRAEVRSALAQNRREPLKALERLIQDAKREPAPDNREIETLTMLRNALARPSRPARRNARKVARITRRSFASP